MGQQVLFAGLVQQPLTRRRQFEIKQLLILRQAAVPQRIQRAGVQVGHVAGFLSAVGTQQRSLLRVQIKFAALVFSAVRTGQQVGHVSGQRHGPQLVDGFQLSGGAFLLAEKIQAVEQQTQLCLCLRRRRGQRGGDLRHIGGQSHPLNGLGQAMEHPAHLRGIHKIMAAAAGEGKFGITKQPAGAEQLVFQPQAAFCGGRDHPQIRGEKGQDLVCLPHADLTQHQTHGCDRHWCFSPAEIYSPDNPARCPFG